ncbi:MAG: M23 family metallopeptidase [Bacilli bacterium]|nr:M23 family metallopeptidase [Bacilli bacterium]
MNEVTKEISIFLLSFMIILLIVVMFVDNDSLNSLFIDYSNQLSVNEVGVLNVDYDKVVYQDTNVTSVANNSSSNVVQMANTPVSDGWAWPTDGGYTITTYFSAGHKALDIFKGYGTNIYAANNGVVTTVKAGCIAGNLACNGRGGNYVIIKHNSSNYYTVYMHLKDIHVKVGDNVSKGQVIASMGNTGNVIPVPTAVSPYLGTHLHFCLYIGEPYRGGYAVNPMRLY